ncbi:myb-binding protein 1A-like protein [Nephila pilipes]|uniref:Myb-binding protein 1A-like protein n=1 Tax=Nephila pilipes TaxID=299642 RepID=A0A8X6Q3Q1_NEPPI|nr:myb-binding protein 1A-like protein [Nephila pilipes]
MKLVNSDMLDKTEKKVDKNFLDLFWKLTNHKSKSRIDACGDILHILRRKQDEAENKDEPIKDLQYCIERLVKGLASPRDSARLGFSLLLTEIIKHIHVVLIEDVLELVKKHLSLSNTTEKKDVMFGQLFVYSSIVRSSRLADHSHLSYVIVALYDLWMEKSYLVIASYHILLDIFGQISEKKFFEDVWPVLKKKLDIEKNKSSADFIWFLFLLVRMFPIVITEKIISKNWTTDFFYPDNFDRIKKAIKQTTSSLPLLHPLCSEVLQFCISRKDRTDIWNALIDDNLFETDQTEKAYVGFEMVKNMLEETKKKKIVKCILSPKFCAMFTKSLFNVKHPMNPAATNLGNYLSDLVKKSKDPKIQFCILKVFLHSSISPDQIFKKREVSAIIQNLLPDAVKSFYDLLKLTAVEKTESEDEVDGVHSSRFQAVLQIGSLVNHPATVSDLEWRFSVVKFLFLHSFFDLHTPSQDILHCEADCTKIRPNLRESFTNSFFRALNSLYHRTDQHIAPLEQLLQHLLSLTEYADQLMTATNCVSTIFPLEKVQESWQLMKSIVKKLTKQDKKDGMANESNAFQVLFLELGFQLFHDPKHISEILEELHECCKKALHQQKHSEIADDNEPSWVSVVIDILLSLLSKSSHHLRCIVATVFPLLCPFITEESLQPILNVITPEKEGDEPMLVDEEEESDVDFDSGSSSEESDAEESNFAKVDEKFRTKVKEALGPAAEESDAESIVLSDSEMFKMDDALAKVFQSRVRTGHTHLSLEDKTMLHFRIRCLDLVTAYLKSDPPMHMVLHCIQPIISAYEFAHKKVASKHHSQLLHKAVSTLQVLIKIKKFQHLENVQTSELKEHLQTLVLKCHKENHLDVAKKLYSLCVFIVLCFRRLETQKNPEKKSKKHRAYLKIYLSALETFVKGSSSNMFPQFFVSLMDSCPDLAWDFIEPCKEHAFDPHVRLYKRRQCFGLIFEAIKFSKKQTGVTSDQWLNIGNSLIPKAVEALKNALKSQEFKAVHFTELLEVIYAIYSTIKDKTNKSLLERYKDILPLLIGMDTFQVKKLMKKGNAVRRKLILALGGSIPTNKKSKANAVSLKPEENNISEVNHTEKSNSERLNDTESDNTEETEETSFNVSEATSLNGESKQVKRKRKSKNDKNEKKLKINNS